MCVSLIFLHFQGIVISLFYKVKKEKIPQLYCCSVSQSCPTLCNPMDCTMPPSLSFTICWSLLKLMSIESVMPSNHLILCCPLSSCFQSSPASQSFPMSRPFASGSQSVGVSASASVLPVNFQA